MVISAHVATRMSTAKKRKPACVRACVRACGGWGGWASKRAPRTNFIQTSPNSPPTHARTKEVEVLVEPDGRHDEEELDRDGAEGEDAREDDDEERVHVPGLRGDAARDDVGAHGVLDGRLLVAEVGAHEDKGDGDAEPEEDEEEEGADGERQRGALGMGEVGEVKGGGVNVTTAEHTRVYSETRGKQVRQYARPPVRTPVRTHARTCAATAKLRIMKMAKMTPGKRKAVTRVFFLKSVPRNIL